MNSLVKQDIIVGIDLGTSNSCAAVWENKELRLIKDERGNTSIPSIVAFDKKGTLIGCDAKLQQRKNPQNTIINVKRYIGRNYSDEKVQENIKYLPYRISGSSDDNILIHTKGLEGKYKSQYRPEEISAMVLMKLKKIINNYYQKKSKNSEGGKIEFKDVIVTIPAYFNDSQKQATKDAVAIAGLNCVRLINEPTAAALAYGLNNNCNEMDRNVIVYDFGGGTLDVSLLNIDNGTFNVIGTQGDSNLGGNDFDNMLLKYTLGEIIKSNPEIDQILLKKNIHKIKKSCELAKIELSKKEITIIRIKSLLKGMDFNLTLSRDKLQEICEPLWKKCLDPVKKLIKITSTKVDEIDDIILVGGSTRIPYVKKLLTQYFGKKPNDQIDPDHVVAAGAAIQGYILSHTDDAFCRDLVLKDVIPLSLGIETANGIMSFIIGRNSSIPIKESQKFTTQEEEQESVTIKVYEGERRLTKDNFLVGTFVLDKIEKAPKGIPVIVVSISVDVNGIVHVTAVDKKEGVSNSIRVTGNKRRLTNEEISGLIEEAEKWEKHDIYNQEIKEIHIELEGLIEMISFNIHKNKEIKLKEKDKNQIEIDVKKYNKWLEQLIKIEIQMEESDEAIDLSSYQRKIKQIKKKYAPLVIGMDNVESTGGIKSYNYKNNSFDQEGNRFDNEGQDYGDLNLDDEVDPEMLDGEEGTQFLGEKVGDVRRNGDAIKDIKERNKLIDICDNIQHAIRVKKVKLLSHNKEKLLNYIDDIRIWMNVNMNLLPNDYTKKTHQLAQVSQNIIINNKKEVEENNITKGKKKKIKNYREKLINLCNFLSDDINLGRMSINRKSQDIIKKMVTKTLYWVEVKGKNLPNDSKVIKDKIKEINLECSRIKRFNDNLSKSKN